MISTHSWLKYRELTVLNGLRILFVFALLGCVLQSAHAEDLRALPRPLPEAQEKTLPTVTPVSLIEEDYSQQVAAMRDDPMLWQQYQALQAGGPVNQTGGGCGCGNAGYDRCGCNPEVFPWIDGPGSCDAWCVGPRWAIEADGLFLFRDDANWNGVAADLGVVPTLVDQFDHALGGRLFATAYNEYGYGLQIGYEGANDWNGTFLFEPDATSDRTLNYETRLNSLEINFLPRVPFLWKFYSGFRYIEIDENLYDTTVVDKPIPPPVSGGTAAAPFVDNGNNFLLENRLIGFQLGGRRDSWQLGRWISIDTFANAGVYCNKFKRDDVTVTRTTIITGEDLDTPEQEFDITTTEVQTRVRRDFADVAFAGEAGISAVARLNQCLSLRGGYQVMVVDGMGEALDAFSTPQLVTSTVLYHGLQFGLEYRR